MEHYIEKEDYSKYLIKHYTQLIEVDGNNPKYYHIRGCAHYREGCFRESEMYFTKAILLNNRDPLYYQNRGIIYYQSGQYDRAIWDYNTVINLKNMDKQVPVNTESARIFLNRADAYRLQGNLDAAIIDYERVNTIIMNLRLQSKDSIKEIYSCDITEYTSKKDYYNQLLEDYTRLIELNSHEPDYYFIRGNIYFKQKNFKNAARDYTAFIESGKAPISAHIYYKRALCYYNLYYSSSYSADLEKALESVNSSIPINYSLRGYIYFNKKDYEKALADATQALCINPKDAVSYRLKGMIYNQQNRHQEALEAFNKAIIYDGKNAEDYCYRARYYFFMGKRDLAIEDYTRAIALDNDNLKYYKDRGLAYWKLQEHKAAIADLTHVLDNRYQHFNYFEIGNLSDEMKNMVKDVNKRINDINSTELSTLYNCRAYSYFQLKMYDQAKEDCTKAIEICKDILQPYYLRGQIYLNEKNYERAVEDYSKIVAAKDTVGEMLWCMALEERAIAYRRMKQYQKALEDLSELIDFDPNKADYYLRRGCIYIELDEYDKAASDFYILIKLDRSYTHVISKLLNNDGILAGKEAVKQLLKVIKA